MDRHFSRFDEFGFRQLVARLVEVGRYDDAHRVLALGDETGQNAWFMARDARNELEGYLTDLEVAWQAADEAIALRPHQPTISASVASQLRYALTTAVLRGLAADQDPNLIAALVKSGLWTTEHALAWARLDPDPESRLRTVHGLLGPSLGHAHADLTGLALTIGGEISDPDNRGLSVAGLAGDLPPEQLVDALDLIARIDNEGSRAGALRELLPRLPAPLLRQARRVAEAITVSDLRVRALADVAAQLPEPERSHTYDAALAMLQQSASESRSGAVPARATVELVRVLPLDWLGRLRELLGTPGTSEAEEVRAAIALRTADEQPEQAYETAAELSYRLRRDQVFTAVAAGFAGQGQPERALEVASEIRSGEERGVALGRIAETLPERLLGRLLGLVDQLPPPGRGPALSAIAKHRPELASRLLRRVKTIEHADSQVEVLIRIAEALPEPQQTRVFARALSLALTAPTGSPLSSLVPHLPLVLVRRVLRKHPRGASLDLARRSLIVRLAELGATDEAIAQIERLGTRWGHDRAEAVAGVAPYLPEPLLRHARAALRPVSDPLPWLLARVALLPYLTEPTITDVITAASLIPDPLERVHGLAAVTRQLAPAQREPTLTAILHTVREARDHGWKREEVAVEAFQALCETASRPVGRHLRELAKAVASEVKTPAARAHATLALAVCCAEEAAEPAWRAAITAALEHPTLLGVVAAALPAEHAPLLGTAAAALDDQSLADSLRQLAPRLDGRLASPVIALVRRISNPQLRVQVAYDLLPYLPSEQQRALIAAPLLHASERARDVGLSVVTDALALVYAPDPDDFQARWTRTEWRAQLLPEPEARLAFTLLAQAQPQQRRRLLDAALDAALDLGFPDATQAVTALAPLLDRRQLSRATKAIANRASAEKARGMKRPLVALARRACDLRDARRALMALTAVDEMDRSNAVQEAAEVLPTVALVSAADLAANNGDALQALCRRAAGLRALDVGLDLAARITSQYARAQALTTLCAACRPKDVPVLTARIRELDPPAARATALAHLAACAVPDQRRALLNEAWSATSEGSFWRDDQRVTLLRLLGPQLERLPRRELLSLWVQLLHGRAQVNYDAFLLDMRELGPVLARRLGAEATRELERTLRGLERQWS